MKKLNFIVILAILLFSNNLAFATIINVPADQPTIQAGINAAIDGDTVLVDTGRYYENINYNGKNIVVGSLFLTTQDTSYIPQTIIDGNQNGSVVKFSNCEDSTAILCGFTITNGQAILGGGIACHNSYPSLWNLIVTANTAANGGGILCGHYSVFNPNINFVMITNNSADYGGGICVDYNSNPNFMNVIISNNSANFDGGGIYTWSSYNTTPRLKNVTISKNFAGERGGGFYGGDLITLIDNDNRCNIYLNHAGCGNDLYSSFSFNINVIVDTFTVMNPTMYHAYPIENFTFDILHGKQTQVNSDLYVSPNGNNSNSGLSWNDPLKTIAFAMSKILPDSLNPHTIHLSYGIYSLQTNDEIFPISCLSYITLKGSGENETILDANHQSRIVYFRDVKYVTIEKVTIINGLSMYGAGIYCYLSTLSLENIIISSNESYFSGGGIFFGNSNPSLINVAIISNSASKGGGIYCKDSNLILKNVTIADNSANNGTGIYCSNGANPKLVNTILWNNSLQEIYFNNSFAANSITIAYSDIHNGENGIVTNNNGTINWLEGNLDADPLFVDTLNGNFHLQEGSPCIDAGIAYFVWQGDTLVNIPDSAYYGIAPDMGAYEWWGYGIDEPGQSPNDIMLYQSYPNPFNQSTTIQYYLPKSCDVEIRIYNIKGQLVKRCQVQNTKCGMNDFEWNGKDKNGNQVSSGIYFYQIITNDYKEIRKCILLK